VLTRARIDFCSLANNHVMDWGYGSFGETTKALSAARIAWAGAGRDRSEAALPAILPLARKGRVLVLSMTMLSGHTPAEWWAGEGRPGVYLVQASDRGFEEVMQSIAGIKKPGDVLIASIHAGSNFGHGIEPAERRFCSRLLEEGGVDLVHCHSSHHVKAIEFRDGKPILYGSGDVINDYEGIPLSPARATFCPEFGSIVLATFAAETGRCTSLRLQPTDVHRLRVRRAGREDAARVCAILNRESATFGTRITNEDGVLAVDLTG
jgi:poly-gamma-glutamate capsule biosynthesis protein CapA/YwtB (metallophosphatase superfamily)